MGTNSTQTETVISLNHDDLSVKLPSSDHIRNAEFHRDGVDLVLKGADHDVIIENYFAVEPAPYLIGPDGASLSPALIYSFLQPASGDAQPQTDTPPVGAVSELSGEAHVTRLDGTVEKVQIGTPIYQGDVVETNAEGAVNIVFIDETSFAVSEDARLSIDEYVFDPASAEGSTNFSVLKGMFVFTSGLIGREDPDDVMIETPMGSIGIRGTIIAGDVNAGEITVVEGAIVLRDFAGNEMTLANQFETARFNMESGTIEPMSQLAANDVAGKFASVSGVSGGLFSSINDVAGETAASDNTNTAQGETSETEAEAEAKAKANTNTVDPSEGELQNTGAENTPPTGEESPVIQPQPQTQPLQQTPFDQGGLRTTTRLDTTNVDGGTRTFDGSALTRTQPQTNTADGQPTTTTNTTNTQSPPPSVTQPFDVQINILAAAENNPGALVAEITGLNAAFTNVALFGPSAQYFNIFRISENRLGVRLKPGIELDFEDGNVPNIEYTATNGSNTQSVSGSFTLSIVDTPEAPEAQPHLSDPGASAGDGQVWTYDFSQDFIDGDGDTLTYEIVGLAALRTAMMAGGAIDTDTDISIDPATGILTINVFNITAVQDYNITVQATDGDGLSDTTTFNFDVFGNAAVTHTTDQSGTYGTDGVTVLFSGGARALSYELNANNTNHLFGTDNDSVTVNGDSNLMNMGDGDDNLNISQTAIGNSIGGGNGNDTFDINTIQNYVSGDAGDDVFNINMNGTSSLADFTTLSAGVLIEGGAGFDTLHFTSDANPGIGSLLDFTNIDDNFIRSIEKISVDNGDINTVRLSHSDVFEMTDGENVLIVSGDANDTLQFVNNSGGNPIVLEGQETIGGETYNVYASGEITLLVDTDFNTQGLPTG